MSAIISSLRRSVAALLLALAALGAVTVSNAAPASASGSAVAHSYGMQCSTYGWVRTNYPNISVGTTYNQDVYFRTFLQRYTSSGWVSAGSSVWFHGVSNYTGRKALGYFGGQPYYFSYHTSTGTYVAPERGPAYLNLAAGYYRTVEQYSANGNLWSRVSYDLDNPGYNYCWA